MKRIGALVKRDNLSFARKNREFDSPRLHHKLKENIMSELNRKLLEGLIGAPDSQLSERLRKKCEDFNGTNKELIELFEEIYNSCHESSSIVKATVNPEFTRGYFENDI